MSKTKSKFDEIIKHIGDNGPLQKICLTFAVCVSLFMGIQYMNKIIIVTMTDHWCYVPGREETNYTLEEWKNLTIPRIYSDGRYSYSQCTQFINNQSDAVKCMNGWEYDRTWFDMTAATQNDWVCDGGMIPTHILGINRVADMLGTIIFGQLADNYGRKPILFCSLIFVVVGRIALVFTSSWMYLFMVFTFLGSLTNHSVLLCAYILAMEISAPNKRAFITMITGYGWGLGLTCAPLILWLQRDWVQFCLTATLPCLIFLCFYRWIVESPRWLASSGSLRKSIVVLERIAKYNKTVLPDQVDLMLLGEENKNKVYTVLSLFSSPRLAKNIIILVYSLSIVSLVYLCLMLSVNNLQGNPYLNYALMGAADLPVYVISKYGCDRFGRRVVVLSGMLTLFLGCSTMAFIVQDPSKALWMTIFCIFTKSLLALTMKALFLQIMEISPTCIRQTGIAFACILLSILAILGPYIVRLGVLINAMIPYLIYASLAFVAFVGCIFIPETLGQQLPDSLEDGAVFGRDQNIWGKTITDSNNGNVYIEVPLIKNNII